MKNYKLNITKDIIYTPFYTEVMIKKIVIKTTETSEQPEEFLHLLWLLVTKEL